MAMFLEIVVVLRLVPENDLASDADEVLEDLDAICLQQISVIPIIVISL